MTERAKLRYNGVSYYDADLNGICDKECKFQGLVFNSYKIDRKTENIVVSGLKGHNLVVYNIPFGALSLYNLDKVEKIVLVWGSKKYTDDMLMQIGNEVASLWGAYCTEYIINKKEREVAFICNEYGDEFATSVHFNKLSDYLS